MASVATLPRGTKNGHKPVAEAELAPTQLIIGIPVDLIDVGPNVREDPGDLDDLAANIQQLGVLQPVKVRQVGARWELVWGQRRLLASRLIGLQRIPAIVDEDEKTLARLSIEQLSENLQRKDLNPIEEAVALREVLDAEKDLTQAALAERLGRSPSWLANTLRLLGLDDEVQMHVRAGRVSASHAKTMVVMAPAVQRSLATRIVNEKLSAHQIEREVQWKLDEVDRADAKAAKTAKWIPKAVAALEAGKVAKDALVSVRGSAYDTDLDAVGRAIAKAGWKLDKEWRFDRTEGCDCTAIRLDIGGRKAEISGVCTDARHRDRAGNLAQLARKEAEALWDAQNHQLVEAIIPPLRELPTAVLRILHHVLERSHGGYANWEQIVQLDHRQLGDLMVGHFSGRWGLQRIDQAEVLRELGVEPVAEAPAPPAKPKRQPKVPA